MWLGGAKVDLVLGALRATLVEASRVSVAIRIWVHCLPGVVGYWKEVVIVGVGSRTFQTFLCDACGREVIAEEGTSVDGFYIGVQQVANGKSLETENVYACSQMCIDRAIRDALKRETLPPEKKLTETQELWLRGRHFVTNPNIPIYDARDDTQLISTAKEISTYRPTAAEPIDSLDPNWKPEFKGAPKK